MRSYDDHRRFLRADRWDDWDSLETDRKKKIPAPPLQKPRSKHSILIDLCQPDSLHIGDIPLYQAICNRKSHRKFKEKYLSKDDLSFLLWATQGVHQIVGNSIATRRMVPSGGSRHPFETYLCINLVNDIEPGLYRYLPLEHKLCFLKADPDLAHKIVTACRGQAFVGKGSVIFIWTTIPYRSEWRYGFVAHKMIAIEAGHICQNLYLACEAIGAGTCAIGDYRNEQMDEIVGVDGKDEFVVYLAPVGRPK